MPAYHRSGLAGNLIADIKRVYAELQANRPGPALGLCENLLHGPLCAEAG